MVDNLGLTPGTGATIAADDIGGVLYQRVKIAQGADGTGVDVSSAAPLHINMASSQGNVAAVSGSITASATNTPGTAVTASTTGQIVANVVSAGNATFHLVSAAFVGTLVFEASLDGGLNYAPVMAIREDGTGNETSTALSIAAAFIRTYTVGIPGFAYFRVRASAFTSGAMAVYITQGPFLIETSPSLAASTASIGAVAHNAALTQTTATPATVATASGAVFTSRVVVATATSTTLVLAPGTGLSVHVTDVSVSNSGATLSVVTVGPSGLTQASAAQGLDVVAAATGGGGTINLQTPFKLAANTALVAVTSAASTSIYINVSGYVAP
jgi:hypothetical protein